MIQPGAALINKTNVNDEPFILIVNNGHVFYEQPDGMRGTMTVEVAERDYHLVDQLEQCDVDASLSMISPDEIPAEVR